MARWVQSVEGRTWLNLDRLDVIGVMTSSPPGKGALVIAERSGAPNVILSKHPDEQAARLRVRQLIGDDFVDG
jgi:hypothetical protein